MTSEIIYTGSAISPDNVTAGNALWDKITLYEEKQAVKFWEGLIPFGRWYGDSDAKRQVTANLKAAGYSDAQIEILLPKIAAGVEIGLAAISGSTDVVDAHEYSTAEHIIGAVQFASVVIPAGRGLAGLSTGLANRAMAMDIAAAGTRNGGMQLIPFIGRTPTTLAGPELSALFESVARDPRFLQVARVPEAELLSSLDQASFRVSGVLQGGYAGRVPIAGAAEGTEELVLGLSPLHMRRAAAAHELFHLTRDLQGLQSLSLANEPPFFARLAEESVVWRLGFRYAPVATSVELAGNLVIIALPAGVVIVVSSF